MKYLEKSNTLFGAKAMNPIAAEINTSTILVPEREEICGFEYIAMCEIWTRVCVLTFYKPNGAENPLDLLLHMLYSLRYRA